MLCIPAGYLLYAGISDGEGSLGVVREDFCALNSNQKTAVLLLLLQRPVLVTLPLRNGETIGHCEHLFTSI